MKKKNKVFWMNRLRTTGWAWAIGLLVAGNAAAAVSVYMPPEEISTRAALVVEAQVAETRSGLDPNTGALNTYITLRIEHVHRGPAGLSEVVVREPGGRWGDLVHQLDAVPVYHAGEHVYTYLEPAADGALRTVGMFFGKFRLEKTRTRGPLIATRDLEGQGTILGRAEQRESFTRNDLVALTAGVPYRASRRVSRSAKAAGRSADSPAWNARPPEWERVEWDDGRSGPRIHSDPRIQASSGGVDIQLRQFTSDTPRFVALSSGNPARWNESDSGIPVVVHIEPAGNPLNDAAAAVHEIARALDAWTDIPQSRLHLTLGNTNYDYSGQFASPTSSYSGVNVVLFDDPYEDISDPTGCSGVLAVGGYWRSVSSAALINNVSFHPALQLYVILNNSFECFLANADNLAEVVTHEIGHGIGFGHSGESDAIMRSGSYGSRGPRLGDDDIDAAHCHYPHTLTLLAPNGGEVWTAGSTETIAWSATSEAGGDPGSVDLEYSTDGGSSWLPIAAGTANDGSHSWTVANAPGDDVRLRVVRHALGTLTSPYPVSSCSNDMSDNSLSITTSPPVAGSVSADVTLEKLAGGSIRVRWGTSCSGDVDDYAIYAGSLAALRAGSWDHTPVSCSAGTDLVEDIVPGGGASYYLVAARAGAAEGSLGADSAGQERPAAAAACAIREAPSCSP